MLFESQHESRQVLSCELPLEGLCHAIVVLLESEETISQLIERSEIIRRQYLALQNREVDLHLIKPACVDGGMDGNDGWPSAAETLDAFSAAMGRTVVHDPEDALGRAVGLLPHDLRDEPFEGHDAGLALTAAEDLRSSNVPGRQICPSALALVFMLDSHRHPRARRQCGMNPPAGLNAGLLVRGDYEIVVGKRSSFPGTLVQIQDAPGFFLKLGVSRENPTAMTPRADSIFVKPSPQRRLANGSDEAPPDGLSLELWDAVTGERKPGLTGKLASQGLNRDDDSGGKSEEVVLAGIALRARRPGARRSAFATSTRFAAACPTELQSRRWVVRRRRRG